MKLKIWKSLTFVVGLVLFIVAFITILVAGSILNPPPYQIVVAVQDIEPYTILDKRMLAVDEQTMNVKVAARLVHEAELDRYLGNMVIETIHAGEPLRRNAVVSAENPAAARRLSLALTDPDMVAVVVPVDSKSIPSNVSAGDYVNITMGIEGNISQLRMASDFDEGLEDYTDELEELVGGELPPIPGLVTPTPTPSPTPVTTGTVTVMPTATVRPTALAEAYVSEDEMDVKPPLAKILLPQVTLIGVTRERVSNPSYGMSMGEGSDMQPAFIDGDIEAITVLIPRAAEELLYFAIDNGTIHISVVSHLAVEEGPSPSTAIMWDDVVGFIEREREAALEVMTDTVSVDVEASETLTTTVAAEEEESDADEDEDVSPTDVPEESESEDDEAEESTSEEEATGAESVLDALGFNSLTIVVCAGAAVAGGIGVVGLQILRQRKKGS